MGEYYYMENYTRRELITDITKAHSEPSNYDLAMEWVVSHLFWNESEEVSTLQDPHADYWMSYHPNAPEVQERKGNPFKNVTGDFWEWFKKTGIDVDALAMVCPECGEDNPDKCTNVCDDVDFFVPANKESIMEESPTYITITGHRPNKLGGYDPKNTLNIKVYEALEAKMVNAVRKFDNVVFRIGMAIGVDQMAAHICVKHGFVFDAYVPCEGQESRWPKNVQDEYRKLLTHAQNVYVTYDGTYPGAWVMQKRNEQMVDGTDYLLSVYDGTGGGTGNCVKYAQSQGVTIVNINPREL